MIYGVIGAMEEEIVLLKSKLTGLTQKTLFSVTFYSGKLCGKDVVLAKSGVGKVSAAITAALLVNEFHAGAVINVGVAGSVSDLTIGDVALSSSVVEYDMDTTPLGDPRGFLTGLDVVNIPADETLCRMAENAAKDLGLTYRVGVICSGDKFITEKADKEFLTKTFSGLCVEMEGAAVGHVCRQAGVPFLVIRSVSDNGDSDHVVEFRSFCKDSAKRAASLLEHILLKTE